MKDGRTLRPYTMQAAFVDKERVSLRQNPDPTSEALFGRTRDYVACTPVERGSERRISRNAIPPETGGKRRVPPRSRVGMNRFPNPGV
jgi:hypothetical protein